MTDGNTALQVSPVVPTEDEMNKVQEIFHRAISAIVDMSRLKDEVEKLRADVHTFQTDVERLRKANEFLDDQLAEMRQARDEARRRANDAEYNLATANREIDNLRYNTDQLNAKITGLETDLHNTRNERDDYGMKTMDLEDKLKAVQAKLDAVREGYKSIFGEATPPEPSHEPVQTVEEAHVAASVSAAPHEPEPATVQKYSEWAPGRMWNFEYGAYVDEPKQQAAS